jgi:OOP family OmpA-OmpF porin
MDSKKSLLLAFSAAAVFALPSAHAEQQPASRWYLGGGLGNSKFKLDDSDFDASPASQTRDESDNGWKAFAGFNFTRNFGAELMYANLGQASVTYRAGGAGSALLEYDATSWVWAATARYPIGQFSVLGRLGAARNEANLQVGSASGALAATLRASGIVPGTSSSETKSSLYWGLGAQYDFARSFGVRLDYDNFGKFGNEADTGRAKVDMWSINAVVRF